MGFEDRDYYRDESSYGSSYGSSYEPNQPVSGVPGFRFDRQSMIVTLIVINVLVFFADMFTSQLTYYDVIRPSLVTDVVPNVELKDGSLVPADKIPSETHWLSHFLALKADQPWQVWTFLTSGFAHSSLSSDSGVFHILLNMVTLFFLGRPVEESMGKFEFLRFYLISIVIGCVGWYAAQWLMGVDANGGFGGRFIVGASGAVSAVVVYFIFQAPNVQLLLFGVVPVKAWVVGILFLLSNFYNAVTQSNVAWEAHLAGGAFGALCFQYKLGFGWLKWPFAWPSGGSGGLRVHRPDDDPPGIDPKLQAEADRILEKINEQGQDSLTSRERKTLERYSAAVRRNRGY